MSSKKDIIIIVNFDDLDHDLDHVLDHVLDLVHVLLHDLDLDCDHDCDHDHVLDHYHLFVVRKILHLFHRNYSHFSQITMRDQHYDIQEVPETI